MHIIILGMVQLNLATQLYLLHLLPPLAIRPCGLCHLHHHVLQLLLESSPLQRRGNVRDNGWSEGEDGASKDTSEVSRGKARGKKRVNARKIWVNMVSVLGLITIGDQTDSGGCRGDQWAGGKPVNKRVRPGQACLVKCPSSPNLRPKFIGPAQAHRGLAWAMLSLSSLFLFFI